MSTPETQVVVIENLAGHAREFGKSIVSDKLLLISAYQLIKPRLLALYPSLEELSKETTENDTTVAVADTVDWLDFIEAGTKDYYTPEAKNSMVSRTKEMLQEEMYRPLLEETQAFYTEQQLSDQSTQEFRVWFRRFLVIFVDEAVSV